MNELIKMDATKEYLKEEEKQRRRKKKKKRQTRLSKRMFQRKVSNKENKKK